MEWLAEVMVGILSLAPGGLKNEVWVDNADSWEISLLHLHMSPFLHLDYLHTKPFLQIRPSVLLDKDQPLKYSLSDMASFFIIFFHT